MDSCGLSIILMRSDERHGFMLLVGVFSTKYNLHTIVCIPLLNHWYRFRRLEIFSISDGRRKGRRLGECVKITHVCSSKNVGCDGHLTKYR